MSRVKKPSSEVSESTNVTLPMEMAPVESQSVPTEPGVIPDSQDSVKGFAQAVSRRMETNGFAIRTVNLDGYRVHLLQSQGRDQMQIRFGSGSPDDKPSDTVRDFIKSQEGPQGERFHWNNRDRDLVGQDQSGPTGGIAAQSRENL